MIFKVVAGKPVRETNNNIDAVPEFLGVDDDALKYVFLMWDYDSPYSRLSFDIRKPNVLVAIGLSSDKQVIDFFTSNASDITKAMEAFEKMQYSVDHDTIIAMKNQIEQWNKIMKKEKQSDSELNLIQKVFGKIPEYMQHIKALEEIVGYRDKGSDDINKIEKTSLEQYMDGRRKSKS